MRLLQWRIFHDGRMTIFCVAFALRMEITLHLRFVFVRQYEVFFITLQLSYVFVRSSYGFR